MVGRAIAADLSLHFEVTSADLSAQNLEAIKKSHGVQTMKVDFSKAKEIQKAVATADLVVGAVPGFLGFAMLRTVIEAGKNIVDISFFPEDPFELDKLAKKNKVSAIVDCGVAPGMDNIILGYHYERMQVEKFLCLVGGLPVERNLPWQYKAPFSPVDVIEEYTRPARLVEHGKIVTRPALSEPAFLHFDGIGTLEAFNTDGLRTLLKFDIPDMAERTLRYPGHIDIMRTLRDAGFFDDKPIDVKGMKVRPVDVAGKILFKQWKYEAGEEDFTVMRVVVEGKEDKKPRRYTYNLLDKYNHRTGVSSMARTTGYTAAAAVHLLANKTFKAAGIIAPEALGANEACFRFIMKYLEEREVIYKCVAE